MNGQLTGQPCISCDSSDALTIYPKGDAYCFSCETYFHPDQVEEGSGTVSELPSKQRSPESKGVGGPARDVPQRGLQEHSLAYYGVKVGVDQSNGEPLELHFPVYRQGKEVGYKVKNLKDKTFRAIGSIKEPDLFGMNKAGSGGKLLIITEGEEDCMSAYQLLAEAGKNYKVVSLPNGGSVGAIKKHLTWVEGFESICLNLDNDEVGQRTAEGIAQTLTPGKVKIMTLPKEAKDANEYLMNGGKGQAYLKAIWNAKPYRPDGIVNLRDTWDTLWEGESVDSIPYPWHGLNAKLYGIREREVVTWTAGTGIGKSAVLRELEHWLLNQNKGNIGILALEESVSRTNWGLIAIEANLPLAIREERKKLGYNEDSEDVKGWFDATMGTGRLHAFDHWGSANEEELLAQIRFMIRGLECKWVVLDHISIVVSAMNHKDMDERKAIDSIMTNIRKMAEETGAGIHIVSHLRRVEGNRGHEQGLEIGLSHLRGSQAIAQLSDAVIALERNQQAVDEKEANLTFLRVLKNRYAGLTGPAGALAYDRETGRLTEVLDVATYLAPTAEEAGC